MHLPTHLAISWALGAQEPHLRDRRLVAWAGIAPDLDAASALWGIEAYGRWHHTLTHGLPAALAVALVAALAAQKKARTVALVLATFHLHLVCDLVGSGVGWTIAYLYPLHPLRLHSPIAWALNGWPNILATLLALGFSGWAAVRYRRTFAEALAPVAVDRQVANQIRRWARRSGQPA